jgi:hypothetical protein
MSNAGRTPKRVYTGEQLAQTSNLRTEQFNLRLSARDVERLDSLAAELELTRAGVIRHLLKQAKP